MKFSKESDPLDAGTDEMTQQEAYELIRKTLLSDEHSEPGKRKRQMLAISNIDPALIDILKKRSEARGIPLYRYCTDLLVFGMIVEDKHIKRRSKSR